MSNTVEIGKWDQTIAGLLKDQNPAIQYWTLRDLMKKSTSDPEVASVRERIASWGPVAQYLHEQNSAGYWGDGEDVYWPKWRATVWALILLAEMGVPGTNPQIKKSCEYFLRLMDQQDRSWPAPKYPDDDLRGWRSVWEPCVTGNMARTLAEFGFGDDNRVREMFEWLVKYQRDDGGWNCETEDFREGNEPVHHSSFMSTIEPLWAFTSLTSQKWPRGGKEAVARGIEFLLAHRVYKSDRTGKVIRPEWTQLHFPLFYFYDILHGLRVLTALGFGSDERTKDARELLASKRLSDGTWPMEATYLRSIRRNFVKDSKTGQWHSVKEEVDPSNTYGSPGKTVEVPEIYSSLGEVGRPNPWVTLNALRVLRTD